ncbi:putative non-specific serine/threonine protein kinase [Rosa chinensis]|uniref:Putative non-specific serine/threonine protein kinase n=1 Tax=Rosa chinensis TaxID=74649 RepID=A0A2P6SFJ1_ROSCH|nr:putative non-specific serine/threonine protein kinase [Rosa chinensis]
MQPFEGTISSKLFELEFLEYLDLSLNQLNLDSIRHFIGSLRKLRIKIRIQLVSLGMRPCVVCTIEFQISTNNLSGQLSDLLHMFFASCPENSLETLDLSDNHLEGTVPNLSMFSSLKELYLQGNRLTGRLPESIGQMSNMEVILLGKNSFTVEISETHFSKLSQLIALDLSYSSFIFNFDPGWVPPFQLSGISILQDWTAYSIMASSSEELLSLQLCHLKQIQILDFSVNNISGFIPRCLHNSTSLAQNGFSATIVPSISQEYSIDYKQGISVYEYVDEASLIWKGTMWKYKSTRGLMKSIDLSCNSFTEEIPSEIRFLVGLVSLNLLRNQLTGPIPQEINWKLAVIGLP